MSLRLRSVVAGAARRMLPPGIALGRSNNILVPEMLPNMFVTCFYAIIELDTGRIQFANPAAERLSRGVVIGRSISEVLRHHRSRRRPAVR